MDERRNPRLSLVYDENLELVEFPCALLIGGTVSIGCCARIKGTIMELSRSFTISLQTGPNVEDDDIAFHLMFKFAEERCVTWNDRQGEWGMEVKDYANPLEEEQSFEILIKCAQDAFEVLINRRSFCSFTYRNILLKDIKYLVLQGDVTIDAISFEKEETPPTDAFASLPQSSSQAGPSTSSSQAMPPPYRLMEIPLTALPPKMAPPATSASEAMTPHSATPLPSSPPQRWPLRTHSCSKSHFELRRVTLSTSPMSAATDLDASLPRCEVKGNVKLRFAIAGVVIFVIVFCFTMLTLPYPL